MFDQNKYRRALPDSPTRCQGPSIGGNGQCPYESQEGTEYCVRHSGQMRTQEKKRVSMYHLEQYQARVEELAGHGEVKTLRDEIGIARMVLEKVIVSCGKDHNMLVIASPRISDLVTRIEKLVTSCHRLETSAGALLDKTAVIQLAGVIVGIVTKHMPDDPEALEAISNDIIMAILEQKAFKGETPSVPPKGG